jgi:hypothetical protein
MKHGMKKPFALILDVVFALKKNINFLQLELNLPHKMDYITVDLKIQFKCAFICNIECAT